MPGPVARDSAGGQEDGVSDLAKTPKPLVGFDDLKEGIETAPMTWLPALFIAVVKACLKHNVFLRGGMARYCRQEEEKTQ